MDKLNKKMILNGLIIAVIIILLLILHFGFIPNFSEINGKFNLLIILAGLLTLKYGIKGIIWSGIIGILIDSLNGDYLTIYTIAFIISSVVTYLLFKILFNQQTVVSVPILIAIFTLITYLTTILGQLIISISDLDIFYMILNDLSKLAVWQIFINAIISLILFFIINFLSKRFSKRFIIKYG